MPPYARRRQRGPNRLFKSTTNGKASPHAGATITPGSLQSVSRRLLDALHTESADPTAGVFDFIESRLAGVAQRSASNLSKSRFFQFAPQRLKVPHPQMGAVAHPLAQETGHTAGPSFGA